MNRNIALDTLKLVMVFMVVGIHAGFFRDISTFIHYVTANGVFRIAVPVFLLINGFYFFRTTENKEYIKWFSRIIILYAVWMLIYSPFWLSLPEASLIGVIKFTWNIAFGHHHLWYISSMVGAAAILLMTRNISTTLSLFLILLSFTIGVLIQYFSSYQLASNEVIDSIFSRLWAHRNFLFFSYPFFFLGYLINKYNFHQRISGKNIVLITLIGLSLLITESSINYYHVSRHGGFDNIFSLIIICPAIFILFLQNPINGHRKDLSLYATSSYLVHALCLSLLNEMTTLQGTSVTIFTFALSIFVSYFIIKLNNKIKFIL